MNAASTPPGGSPRRPPVEVLGPLAGPPTGRRGDGPRPDVGWFSQGSSASRWALSRLLAARAVGDAVLRSLLLVTVVVAGLAVAVGATGGPTALTVLLALATLLLLGTWAGGRALLRRVGGGPGLAPVRPQLDRLVAETRGDVRRELHRLGLPSTAFTLPLLGTRLLGRRRRETVATLRRFDLTHVVPPGRLDELHLLLDRVPGPR